MINNKNWGIVFSSFFVLFAVQCSAQAQQKQINKDPGQAIRVFAPQLEVKDCPELGVVGVDGNPVKLVFLNFCISSPVYQATGKSYKVYNYDALDQAVSRKLPLPQPITEFPAEGMKSAILIVQPMDNMKGNWEFSLFSDDAKKFPGASRLFLNLTGNSVRGSIAGMDFQIPANGSQIVVVPGTSNDDNRRLVRLWGNYQGKDVPIVDENWSFPPQARGIVLLWQKGNSGDFRLNGITDVLPPPPVAQAAK